MEGYSSLAFPVLIRKVYLWMTLALAITGVTAYGVANSPNLLQFLHSSYWVFFGVVLGELGLVMWLSAAINRLSLQTATLLYLVYSVLNGAVLSMIFVAYSPLVITKVFLITAGTFGAMAFIGYTTKRDLSKMGSILYMALIGLIIASVVNIFLRSSGFDLILSYLGVAIFVGLSAWDVQKIKVMLSEQEYADESAQKMALIGALTLYLDFINLFLYLLRIFGRER